MSTCAFCLGRGTVCAECKEPIPRCECIGTIPVVVDCLECNGGAWDPVNECEFCGSQFEHAREVVRYCSPECSDSDGARESEREFERYHGGDGLPTQYQGDERAK